MTGWNHDISKAPRGHYDVVPSGGTSTRKVFRPERIITAGADGQVAVAYWMPDQQRWNMFARGEQPIAWMPYSGPREYVDAKGKTRYAIDLPDHPTMAESWFDKLLRETRAAVSA